MQHDFFAEGSVVWDLQSTSKFDAIRETIERTTVFDRIPGLDQASLAEAVIRRECEQSTGFGHGIAISHGRSWSVPSSAIALGISRRGIEYEAFDGLPVHLLFVVASHPERPIDYLRILASVATIARNDGFRHEILSCGGAEIAQKKVCASFNTAFQRAIAS